MLVLLALDSVGTSVVDELAAEGRMPVLAGLRERGRTLPLETPARYLTAATYPSLWLGSEPAEHGVYHPFQWSPERQRVVTARSLPLAESIWERLAAAGRRVLVVDPYEARRPARETATCISGWQFANRVVLERWSSPGGALREWERRLGRGPAADEVFGAPSVRGLRALRRALLPASDRAARLVAAMLPHERVDLVVVTFSALHVGGHQFWDPASVLDPGGRGASAELQTTLRELYVGADGALGRILAALPREADVIVYSALGMGPNTSLCDLLPDLLDRILARQGARAADASRVRATIPTGVRAAVARLLPGRVAVELAARLELRGTDWKRTRAFAVPSDSNGLVRVNVRGRERDGIVDPSEVDDLCDEIAAGLATFEYEDGAPAVAEVARSRDVVTPGRQGDRLPDLVVRWGSRPAARVERVVSQRFGLVERSGPGTGRSGNHTDEAWALLAPGAATVREPVRGARVTDLAATAAALHGLETDGEPLLERV